MKSLTFSLIIVVLLFSFLTFYTLAAPMQVKETLIEIKNGESALSIANKLSDNKIIRSKNWFLFYTKMTGSSHHLQQGKYLFNGNYSIMDVISLIKDGKIHLQRVTIPEGLTLRKTFQLLDKKGFGSAKIYHHLSMDTLFIKKLTGFSARSLEGFLYPDTYFFPEEASEEFILQHLTHSFFVQTSDIDFKPHPMLTYYEIIILASIVEKEAKVEDEKPLIASVYLNRLEHGGYKLQADPTVAYFLEEAGKRREKIYYKDLEIDSPYNTYIYYGLPPTPICSPAKSSILAVLNPAESDYLFFFADNRGGHIFSKTYHEHLKGLQELRRQNGN
jgi:UPF0755 protein